MSRKKKILLGTDLFVSVCETQVTALREKENPPRTFCWGEYPLFTLHPGQWLAPGCSEAHSGFQVSSCLTTKSTLEQPLPELSHLPSSFCIFIFFTTLLFLHVLFFSCFAMLLHQYLVSKYLVSTLLFLYCLARITCQFTHSPHSSSALAARRITWETSKRYPSPTAGQLSQNLRVRLFVKSFPDDTAVQPGLRNADFIDIN